MASKPITRQRSEWAEVDFPANFPMMDGMLDFRRFGRNVGDGALTAIVAIEEGIGWHLSISFAGKTLRYPRWDEIIHAREQLLPSDIGFVMHLPALDEYIAVHDTTFHLHQVLT